MKNKDDLVGQLTGEIEAGGGTALWAISLKLNVKWEIGICLSRPSFLGEMSLSLSNSLKFN